MNICKVEDCENRVKAYGYCTLHHLRLKKHGSLEKPVKGDGRRTHPQYYNWIVNKQKNNLCEEWLDFHTFAIAIGERPSSNHFLRKIDKEQLLSPTNFQWVEFLKREVGELAKSWYARKWKKRTTEHPEINSRFGALKNSGIPWRERIKLGEQMLETQNHLCAICRNPETQLNPRSDKKVRLALDHCHKTNKLRGMLCWRCNTTLGKVEDSIPLLKEMIAYLEKYSEPE